jgi:hypothetical protein
MLDRRSARISALGCLAATMGWLVPAPAAAWPQEAEVAPRTRHHLRPQPLPAPGRAAIVSGYLPRNHNVPMYNEPPRRPPSW